MQRLRKKRQQQPPVRGGGAQRVVNLRFYGRVMHVMVCRVSRLLLLGSMLYESVYYARRRI
jgi:hypothetical protein